MDGATHLSGTEKFLDIHEHYMLAAVFCELINLLLHVAGHRIDATWYVLERAR